MENAFCTTFYFGEKSGGYANIHYNNLEKQNDTYMMTIVNFFSSIPKEKFLRKILFVNSKMMLKKIKGGKYIDK